MISVIVPSRLQVNPISPGDNLYLDLCLGGILRQSTTAELEVIVGLDHGSLGRVPSRFWETGKTPIRFVEGSDAGQAQAVNAAARDATGDVFAFCEDDDLWESRKLAYQLPLLDSFDLVTCNQRERAKDGAFVRYNNFPTPSGWLMRRATWERLGGFDETFRFHVDTEWLGRANAAGLRRVHVIHDGFPGDSWLSSVAKRSKVVSTDGFQVPLVHRTINERGGMATIARDDEAKKRSGLEHAIMLDRFSEVPW